MEADIIGTIVVDAKGLEVLTSVVAERDTLRAQLAAVTAERDEARAKSDRRWKLAQDMRHLAFAVAHRTDTLQVHLLAWQQARGIAERDLAVAQVGELAERAGDDIEHLRTENERIREILSELVRWGRHATEPSGLLERWMERAEEELTGDVEQ